MQIEVEEFKKQHFANYKQAIIENIKKNTSTLVDEDIMSLLKKPPLEAMDLIKVKFLDMAKKEKIVLNTENLDKIIDNYRRKVISCLDEVKENREMSLIKKVDDFKMIKETNIFKLSKKDFGEVNKTNKNLIKKTIQEALVTEILDKIKTVFKDEEELREEKLANELGKYLKGTYLRQVLENIEFKVIVKDTTLINGVKEQADHYLFTLSNSRLLNEDLEK